MNKFFKELKRRNVIRETIAYIIVAWVVLQAGSILFPIFDAADWILKTLTIVLIAGIPVVMIFSWLYELSDGRIRRTSSKDDGVSEKSDRRLNMLIVVGGIIAISLFFVVGSKVKNLDAPNEYSIAILPFKDLSPDKDKGQLIDGIRENIWDRLQKIEGMDPRSNRSSEAATLEEYILSDVSSKLKVKYLLEGSVQTTENQSILSVQLWNDQDELVWEEDYNNSFDDYFLIQKLVSRDVVDAMNFKIGPKTNKILEASETDNLDAYLLVLKADRLILNHQALDAIPLLEEALDLDPDYANAYGAMAYAYATFSWHYSENPEKFIRLTNENAKKAFELDPNNSKANMALYVIHDVLFDKPEKAFEYLNKALEMNPNDPLLQLETGAAYYFRENADLNKSLFHFKRAYELEPLEWINGREVIETYKIMGRFEEAEAMLNEIKPLVDDDYYELKLAEFQAFRERDWSPVINLYKERTIKDSLNPRRYRQLAFTIDWYWDDNAEMLKNARTAFEIDSSHRFLRHYTSALLENHKYQEVEEIMNTTFFNNCPEKLKIDIKHDYFWATDRHGDLKNLIDSTFLSEDPRNYIWYKAKTGLIDSPDSIEDYIYYQFSVFDRAKLFALIGNRDSLYYYLHHPLMEAWLVVNSNPTMDPYRDEPEYKAFQEKYFLKSTPLPD
ncbi:MAG: hypothetical protein HKN54_07450 [Flavobacteriaceae bacterium]|nr:hypothetical protein [Flavobacteriaceae bacterium]